MRISSIVHPHPHIHIHGDASNPGIEERLGETGPEGLFSLKTSESDLLLKGRSWNWTVLNYRENFHFSSPGSCSRRVISSESVSEENPRISVPVP